VSRFIDEHRGRFGVEPICSTLGVSASAYYQRATAERSARAVGDERLLGQIEVVHAANYHCYGYRRTWLALKRARVDVGRDRVKRLMREAGIQGAKRRGKPWRTTIPDPAAVRAPDRVNRDFSASGSDRLWVADFCYLRCWDGVVFFAFVIDVFSRRVVGWQLAGHMRTDLVLDALRMALSRRRAGADVELVHHSDAGSQYTSYAFAQLLDDHGVLASIGSVGDAYDNALAESFVDSFKTELIADRVWRSNAQLELAIVEYVGWFNHSRLHEALGDVPPAEFEHRNAPPASISDNGSVAALDPKPSERLYAPRSMRERASQLRNDTLSDGGTRLAGFAGATPTRRLETT
jgi:putative transposase